jgi:hypothetical protein
MKDEIIGGWRKLHKEELHNLYPLPNINRMPSQGGSNEQGMWHAWGRRGMHTGFWWESQMERDH